MDYSLLNRSPESKLCSLPGSGRFSCRRQTVNAANIAAILFSVEKEIAISIVLASIFLLNHLKLLRAGLLQVLLILVVFVDLSVANKPLHFLRDKNRIQDAPRILEHPPTHARMFLLSTWE